MGSWPGPPAVAGWSGSAAEPAPAETGQLTSPRSCANARTSGPRASSGGNSGNGCAATAVVQRDLARVDAPAEVRDRGDRVCLARREVATGMVAVARDDDPIADELGQGGGRRGPVERVAVAVERHGAVLDQVAGEGDRGARCRDDDVVIGVAATQEAKLDLPSADLDRRDLAEGAVRRVDDDLVELSGELRRLGGDLRLARLTGAFHEGDAALVPPDRRRPEDRVAEGMVEVAVRVDDDRDGIAGQRPQVVEDLARLPVGRPRIDDQRLAAAQDDPDVLVVERVAAHEDAIAEFDPSVRHAHRPHASRASVTRAASSRATLPDMPSVIGRVSATDGTELRTATGRAADAVGEPAAGPRPRRALRPLRARRRAPQRRRASTPTPYDHRGQGASGGRRGHVDRWSEYHDDLAERLATVRAGADGRPVVLYGHSMGGLIVAGYLLSDRPKPDLVVLAAPGLDSTLAGWKKALAPVLGRRRAHARGPDRHRSGRRCRATRRSGRRPRPTT